MHLTLPRSLTMLPPRRLPGLDGRLTWYQTRSFAAILFRRVAAKTRKLESGQSVDLFLSIARDQAAVIRQKLLESLGTEHDRAVRNKIGDAVAEVARQYSETGIYPPLDDSSSSRHTNDDYR